MNGFSSLVYHSSGASDFGFDFGPIQLKRILVMLTTSGRYSLFGTTGINIGTKEYRRSTGSQVTQIRTVGHA
jgi:hypothetical protein